MIPAVYFKWKFYEYHLIISWSSSSSSDSASSVHGIDFDVDNDADEPINVISSLFLNEVNPYLECDVEKTLLRNVLIIISL